MSSNEGYITETGLNDLNMCVWSMLCLLLFLLWNSQVNVPISIDSEENWKLLVLRILKILLKKSYFHYDVVLTLHYQRKGKIQWTGFKICILYIHILHIHTYVYIYIYKFMFVYKNVDRWYKL